jgi:hypothetical protein
MIKYPPLSIIGVKMIISKNIDYFEFLLGKTRNRNGVIYATTSDIDKIKNAFEKSHDIRKFEIGLYWQRSAYMWGFISVLTAVCAYCFTKIVEQGGISEFKITIVAVSLIASLMGLVFTQMWRRLSATSKYWQENWEYHINVLEEYISGNLHKIHFHNTNKPFKRYSIHEIFTVIINRVFAFWWFMFIVSLLSFFNTSGENIISSWLLEFLPNQSFLYKVAYPSSFIVLFIIIELIIMLPEKRMRSKTKKEKVDGNSLTFTCDEFNCSVDRAQ